MMVKMCFIVKSALQSLIQRPWQNIILIFSVFLGLLFPTIIMTYIVFQFDSLESSLVKDASQVMEIKFVEHKKIDDLKTVVLDHQNIKAAIEYAGVKATVGNERQMEYLDIVAVDEDYKEFYNPAIVAGKFFDFKIEKVCIIGQGLANRFFASKPVGEQLYIQGMPFQIIGVTSSIMYDNEVLVPLQSLEYLQKDAAIRRVYLFKWSSEEQMNKECAVFTKYLNNYGALKFRSSEEAREGDISRFRLIALILVLASSITILYSAINLSTIMMSKLEEDKYELGIHLHHGATKLDLYFKYLFQLLIVSLIASTSIVLSLLFLFPYLGFPFQVDFKIVLMTVLAGFGFTFLLSLFIARSLMRKKIKYLLV